MARRIPRVRPGSLLDHLIFGSWLSGFLWLLMALQTAQATPLFAQRSGRNCANCHVSPTLEDADGWENPRLAQRKCTLSCVSCHVDPTGGGMRNASGRYYGQSTLAAAPTQDRPYTDTDWEIVPWQMRERVKRFLGEEPTRTEGEGYIPDTLASAEAGEGVGQTGGRTTWGRPLGGYETMAFWDGRYDDLNADPLFSVGGDLRGAWWSPTNSFFPMQLDLHAAFHPVHHLMFATTIGAAPPDSGVRLFPRRAFVMVNELPGMSWVKAGIFLPSFGHVVADHTRPVRWRFEVDGSEPRDTVLGVEVGTAPNYPYATLSVFQNDTSMITGAQADVGGGYAFEAGWRDLGWSAGLHAQQRWRGGLGRGDLLAAGVQGGFSPAYYLPKVPLTLLAQATWGRRNRAGYVVDQGSAMVDAGWILRNGVNMRLGADWDDADLASPGGTLVRGTAGLDLTPVPGLTVSGQVRSGAAITAPPSFFAQAHLWF